MATEMMLEMMPAIEVLQVPKRKRKRSASSSVDEAQNELIKIEREKGVSNSNDRNAFNNKRTSASFHHFYSRGHQLPSLCLHRSGAQCGETGHITTGL